MRNRSDIINYKLFMVDADGAFCRLIKNSMHDAKKCQYIGYATNGISGFYSILGVKPDIIILDYILPELDGVALLEKIRSLENYYPYIIMFCGLGNDMIIQQIKINGANVCCVKPCNIEDFIEIIKDAALLLDAETHTPNKSETIVLHNNHLLFYNEATLLLRKISMPPHIKGYHYFRDAIVYVLEDSKNMEKIVDGLYKMIANKNDTTIKNVERSMRHAIEIAWNRCKMSVVEEIFGNTLNESMDRPTNSEMIATLSDLIKMKHGILN